MKKQIPILIAFTAILSIAVYLGISNSCFGNKCEASSPEMPISEILIESISSTEFKSSLEVEDVILLDIRTIEEFNAGYIVGATQLDFYQTANFSGELEKMDKSKEYLIYCNSGNRSGQALSIMRNLGFVRISDLRGGITAWRNSGYEVVN